MYNFGQCDVNSWTDIQQIATGGHHTLGLKSDGTVMAVGSNRYGQCDVSSWNLGYYNSDSDTNGDEIIDNSDEEIENKDDDSLIADEDREESDDNSSGSDGSGGCFIIYIL
ncbi:MAG: hypothetical protein ACMUIP_04550 [bacterium]